MRKISRRTMLTVAVGAMVGVLALSGAALAAGGLPLPKLRSPRAGRSVPAGHVKLSVYIPNPGLLIRHNVFVVVSPRRIVKYGLLGIPGRCGFQCVVATMKRRSAHVWTYTDSYQFPGLWQDTPGKYYWQAYYYPNTGVLGVVPSRIGSFRIG